MSEDWTDPRDLEGTLPTPAPNLDDFQEASGEGDLQEHQEHQPQNEIKPLSNKEILSYIATASSIGLPEKARKQYQRDLQSHPLLELALPLLGLNEVLAKYLQAGANNNPMPDWVRLVAGVGVIGIAVATTRRNYATPYTKTAENPAADGHSRGRSSVDLDELPLGFAANFPGS